MTRPLLFPLIALLVVGEGSARAQQSTEASRAFAEGSQLFEKGDYVGAIEAFNKAYRLKPHFSVLCNIALSHERLGNMVAAAKGYKDCLARGADKAGSAGAVRNSLQRVEGRITWVAVRSPGKGGSVFLDGERVGDAPQRIAVNPGSHVVEVRRPGTEPARHSLVTRGGEEQELELVPTEIAGPTPKVIVVEKPGTPVDPKPRRRLHQAWFWSGVGLTAAMAVVATVLGVQTMRTRDDYEAHPSRDLLDKGVNYRMLTNVFWGLTAASAGATTALFFFTDFSRRREAGGATTELIIGVRRSF